MLEDIRIVFVWNGRACRAGQGIRKFKGQTRRSAPTREGLSDFICYRTFYFIKSSHASNAQHPAQDHPEGICWQGGGDGRSLGMVPLA